ncbi:TetR family transcriptional regulator [Asanoa ferruginea]|uniref:TetR family transcriptional regulator n=2 Tax=Asanoa ferruginea TaxID=53367 RepID=A0A3D9ZCK6_9ACTN|nr:TetR family transcriptional regulator [Asanoa ferruginea]GIF49828.1 TetR family transcriptional regulator [Asanoa ferruginea]
MIGVMTMPNQERRSDRARAAILAAALDLCREQGLARTTMEEIAKKAQVGKQTIYRWWPSKAAVLLEAVNELAGRATDFPDTGDLYADLHTQMTGVATLLSSPRLVPYLSLIGAAQDDPDVLRSFLDAIILPRIRAAAERLRQAQKQGQLREDVDVDDVIELLYGPFYYRALIRTRPVTLAQVDEVLRLALSGVEPR